MDPPCPSFFPCRRERGEKGKGKKKKISPRSLARLLSGKSPHLFHLLLSPLPRPAVPSSPHFHITSRIASLHQIDLGTGICPEPPCPLSLLSVPGNPRLDARTALVACHARPTFVYFSHGAQLSPPISILSISLPIMSGIPGPVYGLLVPPGDIWIPAAEDFPASVSAQRCLSDEVSFFFFFAASASTSYNPLPRLSLEMADIGSSP